MKNVKNIIIILLLALSIFLGYCLLQKEKTITSNEENNDSYYECVSETDGNVYKETNNYKIFINSDYSIKNVETFTMYTYNEVSYASAKEAYLKVNSNIVVDDEKYTITIPGENKEQTEKTWVIPFIEQLEINKFSCTFNSK